MLLSSCWLVSSIWSVVWLQAMYDFVEDCKNSEYDQEIPQSQTADKPMAPREEATQQSLDTRKKN